MIIHPLRITPKLTHVLRTSFACKQPLTESSHFLPPVIYTPWLRHRKSRSCLRASPPLQARRGGEQAGFGAKKKRSISRRSHPMRSWAGVRGKGVIRCSGHACSLIAQVCLDIRGQGPPPSIDE